MFKWQKWTVITALLVVGQSAYSLGNGPDFLTMYMQGMGGTGLASANGHAALAINPAGLSERQAEIHGGLGFAPGLNPILIDYADWAVDNAQHLDDLDTLLTKINPIDLKWAPFKTDFWIHGQHKDIAFSITNDSRYDLAVAEAVLTPVLGVGAQSDLLVTAGRGMVLENGYRFGVSLKYLYRLEFERRLVGTLDPEFYLVKTRLESDESSLSKLRIANEVANTRHGLGINFGMIKDYRDNWRFAVSLLDFPTILSFRPVKPDIRVGGQYYYDFAVHPEIGNRVSVNMEMHEFLIPNVPWFKRPKFGVSLEGFRGERQISYINFGFNDGYPTFGARAGYFIYLGYTYYTEELGAEPGQKPLTFHKIFLEADI